MKYNYIEAVENDIRTWLEDNSDMIDRDDWTDDRDGFESWLSDELWTADSVTGNASGSYTFNRCEAREYVLDNIDLLRDAYIEFGSEKQFAKQFFEEDFESMDVTIRCFLLPQAISDVVNEMESEGYFEIDALPFH